MNSDDDRVSVSKDLVARAAFDMCVSLYQEAEIELRQASRVICSSKHM
jgi:hypothetical protein